MHFSCELAEQICFAFFTVGGRAWRVEGWGSGELRHCRVGFIGAGLDRGDGAEQDLVEADGSEGEADARSGFHGAGSNHEKLQTQCRKLRGGERRLFWDGILDAPHEPELSCEGPAGSGILMRF